MDNQLNQNTEELARLKDIVIHVDRHVNPFLYYLPELLNRPELSEINPAHAVRFAELTLKHDTVPIVADALHILDKLVNPVDGSLTTTPGRDIFYDNRSFFWKELGNHTRVTDIISHIFNKTFFVISVGQQT